MDSLGYVAVRCGNLRGQLGISSSCVTDELGRIMRGPDFAQIAAGFRQNDWEVAVRVLLSPKVYQWGRTEVSLSQFMEDLDTEDRAHPFPMDYTHPSITQTPWVLGSKQAKSLATVSWPAFSIRCGAVSVSTWDPYSRGKLSAALPNLARGGTQEGRAALDRLRTAAVAFHASNGSGGIKPATPGRNAGTANGPPMNGSSSVAGAGMDVADWQAPVSPPQELWVAMAWDGYEGAFVGYVRYDALQENFVISYTDGDQDMYTWQELTQSGAGGGIKTHRWWIMQDVSSSHALRSELLQLLQHINWPQVSLDDYLQPWSFMPWDDGVDDAANTAVAPAAAPPPSRQQPLAVADKAGKEVPVQRGRGRPKGSASKGQGKKSSAPAPGAGTRGTTLNTGNAHAQGAASLGQQPAQPAPSGSGMGTFGVKVTRTVVPVKDDVEGGDGQDGTDGPGGAQAAAWPGHVSVGSDTSMAAGGTQQGQGPRKKQCKERVAAGQKSAASPATPARTGTALPPKLQPQAGEMGGSPGAQGSPQSMDAEANPALQAFEGQLDSVIRQVFSVDLELAKNAHVCWSRIRNDPAAAARMAAKQAVNLQRGVDFAALGAGAGMLVDTLQAVLELS